MGQSLMELTLNEIANILQMTFSYTNSLYYFFIDLVLWITSVLFSFLIMQLASSQQVSDWVNKFIGLPRTTTNHVSYKQQKPCYHDIYIGIVIFRHKDNTQSTDCN